MSESDDGFLDLALTSEEWLRNHFLAKSPERVSQVSDLPLFPSDKVLDLCCGPGYYCDFFAAMVGPSGHVFGVDKDPTHIDVALRRRITSPYRDQMSFEVYDVKIPRCPELIGDMPLDVVVMFNALFYFEEQATLLQRYFDLLVPGGRLIVKDSDFGHFMVSPFETKTRNRVVEAAEHDQSYSFNNFAGRNLFKTMRKLNGAQVTVRAWPYVAHAPLSDAMKHYISTNLITLLDQARPQLAEKDIRAWMSLYDRERLEAHINSPDFIFVMNEMVVIAEKSR